ncbi:MAG: DUF1573 domain-containing protein [Patescibacteria group bacterium]
MKYSLILALVLGAGVLAITLWPAAPAQIGVSTTSVDFGEIDQGGGPVTTSVQVRNDGGQPLNIFRVSTSCGCTTATLDSSPIEPGNSRPLTIQFDPMVHPDENGPITRMVYLQSSDPNQPELEIEITGTVMPRQPL